MDTITDWIRELNFKDFLQNLYYGGWFDFVFPFLLIYALVYTILNNVTIFDNRKPIKVIIALVFALFAIAFPITDETYCGVGGMYNGNGIVSGCTVGTLMMTLFPGVTAFSIGLLALYIILAMLGVDITNFFGDDDDRNQYLKWIFGAIGLLVVIYYYALGFGWNGFDGNSEISEFFKDPALYILVVFGLFFWWVSSDEDPEIIKARKEANKRKKKDKKTKIEIDG